MNNLRDTFGQLRRTFDGSDTFMTGGHQIIKQRQGDKKTLAWVESDKKIQEIILRSFPKMKDNALQRIRAGRWARVIYLYFRMQKTYGQVAAELGIKPRRVEDIIRAIRRAAAGKKASTGKPRSKSPTGRPKK